MASNSYEVQIGFLKKTNRELNKELDDKDNELKAAYETIAELTEANKGLGNFIKGLQLKWNNIKAVEKRYYELDHLLCDNSNDGDYCGEDEE